MGYNTLNNCGHGKPNEQYQVLRELTLEVVRSGPTMMANNTPPPRDHSQTCYDQNYRSAYDSWFFTRLKHLTTATFARMIPVVGVSGWPVCSAFVIVSDMSSVGAKDGHISGPAIAALLIHWDRGVSFCTRQRRNKFGNLDRRARSPKPGQAYINTHSRGASRLVVAHAHIYAVLVFHGDPVGSGKRSAVRVFDDADDGVLRRFKVCRTKRVRQK